MKVTKFEIKFDNPRGVFESGKNLTGMVHLTLAKPIKLRSIKMFFVGEGKTYWDKKQGKSRVKYRARETYLNSFLTFVAAGSQEGSIEHPAGDHVYPFSIPLQSSVPSSFEGSGGYVRYYCKATIDRPWKSNSHVKRIFTVIHHLDLNALPVADPFYAEKTENVEGCCCDDGSFDVSLQLNKTGYVPGEPIVYEVNINNQTGSVIHRISIELKQICTCYARSDGIFSSGNLKPKEFKTPFTLLNGRADVQPNKTGKVHKATTVPSLPPSKLDGCAIIDLKYLVVLKIPHGSSTVKMEKEIIIGTIPIAEPILLPTAPEVMQEPSAPAMAPPSYEEALAPPPSYEDCVCGTTQVRDENDDDNTDGDVMWAPSYPYYDWSQHTNQLFGGQPPSQAQMGQRTEDDDDDDGGRTISHL